MNLWLFSDFLSSEFLETILKPEDLTKAMFLIILDITKVSILF